MRKKVYGTILIIMIIVIIIAELFMQVPVKASDSLCSSDGKKVIYLSFDDAPGDVVTSRILDILKENNVKATFFIVGNRIKGRENILKRIYNEGHSLGLHTYCHKYKYVYSSHEVFIDEMVKTAAEINKVVGVSPNAIRFPGGSYKHLTYEFLDELHKHNFKVYDWNLALSDGIDYKTPTEKLFKEAINTRGRVSPLILLAHCSGENKNTCKVLPRIIKYYKERGYEFIPITNKTPEYHSKIRTKK